MLNYWEGCYSLCGQPFQKAFSNSSKKWQPEHGLDNVEPDRWYPLGAVMQALHEVEETFGHHLLRQVGNEAAARAPLSPDVQSIKTCLLSLNETFRKFHRGENVGGYDVSEDPNAASKAKFIVVASTPYPCSLTGGYLEGYAQRFGASSGQEILVRHDEAGPCRHRGGGHVYLRGNVLVRASMTR